MPLLGDVEICKMIDIILLTATASFSFSFTHPGVMMDQKMLDNLRSRVENRQEPTFSAFQFMTDPARGRVGPRDVFLANMSYEAHPQPCVPVNGSLSPGTRWLACKEPSLKS